MGVHAVLKSRFGLEERLGFEMLLAEISARFINLPATEVDQQIEEAQRRICECLDIDHSSLWQADPQNPDLLLLTHLHRDPSLRPRPDRMVASESFPWVLEQLMAGAVLFIEDTAKTPPAAKVDREAWFNYSIKSSIALPLSVGGEPMFGVLSFDSTSGPRSWPEALKIRLQLVAEIFASALDRRNSDQRVRVSQERLGLAADCANAGLWTLDTRTGQIWATDKTYELFGIDPNESLTFDRVLTAVHPSDRELVRKRVHWALESGEVSSIEYRVPRSDGSVRWLTSRGGVQTTSGDRRFLLMGVIIDTTETRLREQERSHFAGRLLKAQEEERARIGRELHDDLGQLITVHSLRLQQTLRKLEQGEPVTGESLRALGAMVTQIAGKISSISHELHSSELELLGLAGGAEITCREIAEQSNIRIEFTCDEISDPVGRDVEIGMFRVLQEALNNAIKYSEAKKIEVRLEGDDTALRLRVSDDGVGFDPAAVRGRGGMGLVSMRERMLSVGGWIKLQSAPGVGTVIEATVPRS